MSSSRGLLVISIVQKAKYNLTILPQLNYCSYTVLMTLMKVAYSSKVYYCTFQNLTLSYTSIAPTLEVCMAVMLILTKKK